LTVGSVHDFALKIRFHKFSVSKRNKMDRTLPVEYYIFLNTLNILEVKYER